MKFLKQSGYDIQGVAGESNGLVLAQRGPTDKRPFCPRCGSSDTRTSTIAGVTDQFLVLCQLAPRRCRRCRRRFFRLKSPWLKYALPAGVVILAMLSLIAYRSWPARQPARPASVRWSDVESTSQQDLDRALKRDVPQ